MLLLMALTVLDGVLGIGLFFSGLLVLGTSIYQYQNDLLGLPMIAISIILGAMIADNIGFHLGRRAKRLGRTLPFRQSLVDRFYAFMERLGGWDILVVIFGRSFAYSRPIAPFMIGFTGTTPTKYLWMSLVSAILWVGAWTLIGFLSVEGFEGMMRRGSDV